MLQRRYAFQWAKWLFSPCNHHLFSVLAIMKLYKCYQNHWAAWCATRKLTIYNDCHWILHRPPTGPHSRRTGDTHKPNHRINPKSQMEGNRPASLSRSSMSHHRPVGHPLKLHMWDGRWVDGRPVCSRWSIQCNRISMACWCHGNASVQRVRLQIESRSRVILCRDAYGRCAFHPTVCPVSVWYSNTPVKDI